VTQTPEVRRNQNDSIYIFLHETHELLRALS
jgi:hypothetical protein